MAHPRTVGVGRHSGEPGGLVSFHCLFDSLSRDAEFSSDFLDGHFLAQGFQLPFALQALFNLALVIWMHECGIYADQLFLQ